MCSIRSMLRALRVRIEDIFRRMAELMARVDPIYVSEVAEKAMVCSR